MDVRRGPLLLLTPFGERDTSSERYRTGDGGPVLRPDRFREPRFSRRGEEVPGSSVSGNGEEAVQGH